MVLLWNQIGFEKWGKRRRTFEIWQNGGTLWNEFAM